MAGDGPEPGPPAPAGSPVDRGEADWVEARPFRAHLRHLMAVGSLDEAEVAVVLGLSTTAVRHLLEGRAGRPLRRISPHTARLLLRVRAADLEDLRCTVGPADAGQGALRRLSAAGWSLVEVATATGFGVADLAALERAPHCSRLLAVRVVVLARTLPPTHDDDRPLPLVVAA